MLWGAISTEGIHPKKNPIWLNDWLDAYCNKHKKKKNTMNSYAYSTLLRNTNFPLLEKELNGGLENYIWEDDVQYKTSNRRCLGNS